MLDCILGKHCIHLLLDVMYLIDSHGNINLLEWFLQYLDLRSEYFLLRISIIHLYLWIKKIYFVVIQIGYQLFH